MADVRKIAIDEVVESAAAGVLRALDARGVASKPVGVPDLVKSGFNVDIIIRAGGRLLEALEQQGRIGQ